VQAASRRSCMSLPGARILKHPSCFF
jgi:hypothetical protein